MKKCKILLGFLFALILSTSLNISVFASDSNNLTEELEADYTEQFSQFIENALKNIDSFNVYTQDNIDVTTQFLQIYYNGGIDKAHTFARQNECTLNYQTVEEINPNSRTTIKSRNVYDTFYTLETCTDGTYTKEWLMKLTGIYSYNADTGAITSARNPTLSIDVAEFGAAWLAYMNNVSTSYSIISTNTIKFTGKYHMYGTCSPPGLDGAFFTKDFKSHTVSFTSTE